MAILPGRDSHPLKYATLPGRTPINLFMQICYTLNFHMYQNFIPEYFAQINIAKKISDIVPGWLL
jgi:hypothetical protein